MSENKTQFIITSEGRFFREDIVRNEIDPGPELEKCFKASMAVKLPRLVTLPTWGAVSVAVDEMGVQHWSVQVEEINFNTSYRVKGEGKDAEMIPRFVEDLSSPSLNITWNKSQAMAGQAKGMDIRFVVLIHPSGSRFVVQKQYLYAFDDAHNAYRLPISNLYDTCELCNGVYEGVGNTALETLTKSLTQFRNSSWNSDLWKDEDKVENFIRFQPLETGFNTLPIKSPWTKWCNKVVTPLVKNVIV